MLPAMQSLIHGNFEGAAQKKAYALVGPAAAIAAAVGPLLGPPAPRRGLSGALSRDTGSLPVGLCRAQITAGLDYGRGCKRPKARWFGLGSVETHA